MNFKEYRLCELSNNITDGVHNTVINDDNGECYLLSCKNIKNGKVIIGKNERKINKQTLEKLRKRTSMEKDDVLVTSVGTIGEMSMVEEKDPNFEFQRSVAIIKPNKKMVIPKYLYYVLKNEKAQIESLVKGAVQKCLFLGDIKNISLKIPEIEEQIKTVKIIENIDKKININNQINDNLHNYCKLLFSEIFNKECKKEKLEDVCEEITRGYTKNYVDKSNIINLNQKVNKGEYLEKQYFKYLDESQTIPNNRFVRKNDVLLNSLGQGTLGRVHLYREESDNVVIDQHITILRVNNRIINSYYLYYLLITNEFQNELEGLVTGTTGMQMLNISSVRELKIPIPSKEVLDEFENKIKYMQEKININNLQNEILIQLRDTLLPKIMNGEINLDKIKI